MRKKIVGPFTAHVRVSHPRGGIRMFERTSKTFPAPENYLRWHEVHVTARWITNAQGVVYSPASFGDPAEPSIATALTEKAIV